jgi:hypothetical protein
VLRNFAIIAAEEELCKDEDGKNVGDDQMGGWKTVKDLFTKLFN